MTICSFDMGFGSGISKIDWDGSEYLGRAFHPSVSARRELDCFCKGYLTLHEIETVGHYYKLVSAAPRVQSLST